MSDEQRILPPDLDRLSEQRAVVDSAAKRAFGEGLPGGLADLAVLQRMVDEEVFSPRQTYELQSLGLVLGEVLASNPGLTWVTVQDEYGIDPALRYKNTSILVFPLTMISKREEGGREVDIASLYEATLAKVREWEAEGY